MALPKKNPQKKPKYRKNKLRVVFDEKKRKEFLTGFHKRKLERKKKAQDKLAQDIKEEKKRLKKEARESFKKLLSYQSIPLLENLATEEYEEDDVTVKVTELSTSEIAKRNNWIGENQPQYEEVDSNSDDTQSDVDSENENKGIPGMELKQTSIPTQDEVPDIGFRTEKDLKKALKTEATRKFQESKAFQQKMKLEQRKNRKLQIKQKKKQEKLQKRNKKRGGRKR